MSSTLNFSLVSPNDLIFSGDVEHVVAPGVEGEFGVLPRHAPFMTALKNGVVRVIAGDTVTHRIYVQGGFADVTPDGLTILAERASNLENLNAEDVAQSLEAAQVKRTAGGDDADMPDLDLEIAYLSGLQHSLAN